MAFVIDVVNSLEELSWALLEREDVPEDVERKLRELRVSLHRWLGAGRESGVLFVPACGQWLVLPSGAHVDLRRRPALHAIAHALITAHVERPGVGVSASELIASAWPGAEATDRDLQNRLYVSLTRLRQLGFQNSLRKTSAGWLLEPSLRVVREGRDDVEVEASTSTAA